MTVWVWLGGKGCDSVGVWLCEEDVTVVERG